MERFFLLGCQISEIELKELLLRKYHSLCIDMPTDEYISFIKLAVENEKKDKAERLYLALVPKLIEANKFMTFDKFYEDLSGKNFDFRPAEDILSESAEIEKRLKNGS